MDSDNMDMDSVVQGHIVSPVILFMMRCVQIVHIYVEDHCNYISPILPRFLFGGYKVAMWTGIQRQCVIFKKTRKLTYEGLRIYLLVSVCLFVCLSLCLLVGLLLH